MLNVEWSLFLFAYTKSVVSVSKVSSVNNADVDGEEQQDEQIVNQTKDSKRGLRDDVNWWGQVDQRHKEAEDDT